MANKFSSGLKDGIAIGLGYLSVSFSFGIMAVSKGLAPWQAVLISITNLTSAGQVAGVGIMSLSGGMIEMIIAQFIINLRYGLMAISLTQKADSSMNTLSRLICAHCITDEIFGVASSKESFGRNYFLGLAIFPVAGWVLGTLLGAVLGNIFPEFLTDCLSMGIYGMFISIVIPKAKKDKLILLVCGISCLISLLLFYTPASNYISSGFAIIISAVIASLIGVFLPSKKKGAADET